MHCLETNLKQIIKDQHCLKMPSLVFDFFPRKKKVVKEDGINEKAHISTFESVSPMCSHRRYYQQHYLFWAG